MSGDDVQYTYKATSDPNRRPYGFFTHSSTLDYGVNVQGSQVGVYGEALAASPGVRTSPNGTGVCGLGDNIGVIGQGDPNAPVPQPTDTRPTGVLGLGQVGVHGDSTGVAKGVGVEGSCDQGVGVQGASTGLGSRFGVFGQAQVSDLSDPFSPTFDLNTQTGVVGVGDVYGGAFVTTAQTDRNLDDPSLQYANIQLTPANVKDNGREFAAEQNTPPRTAPIAPDLPSLGQPGDILVVNQNGPGPQRVQVWVCLAAAPGGPPPVGALPSGAVWGRVSYDYIFVTQPEP